MIDDGAIPLPAVFKDGDRVRIKYDGEYLGPGEVVGIHVRAVVEYVVRWEGGEDYFHSSALVLVRDDLA